MASTYSMGFKCWNCGNEWSREIKKGYIVKRSGKETLIRPEGAVALSDIEKVECPECETKEEVRPQR